MSILQLAAVPRDPYRPIADPRASLVPDGRTRLTQQQQESYKMSTPLIVVEKTAQNTKDGSMQWMYLAGFLILAPLVLEPFERQNEPSLSAQCCHSRSEPRRWFQRHVGPRPLRLYGNWSVRHCFHGPRRNWDYWQVLPVVLIVGFIMGVIIGLPALRVKGLYLALVTIAQAAELPTLVILMNLYRGSNRRT